MVSIKMGMRSSSNGWYIASIEAPMLDNPVGLRVYQGWVPCIDWCKETFGNSGLDAWHYVGEGVFEFREEPDYAWFTLRWA
jgi:hypothetical protein